MLSLSNVDAGYGAFQALFGVSMRVEAGEAVAVIGANGAGKTTLLRVVSGLLPATAGEMTMEGVSLRVIPPHRVVETGIAHVPESRRLFPRLSVEGNLKMGAFVPACELRSPAPFTDDGFRAFNESYVGALERWGVFRDGGNPVARSNVCPRNRSRRPSRRSTRSRSRFAPKPKRRALSFREAPRRERARAAMRNEPCGLA